MERKDIVEKLDQLYSISIIPRTFPLMQGDITDPNKSVYWNEEVVAYSQKVYREELKTLKKKKEEAIKEFTQKEIYPYIQKNLSSKYSDEGIAFLFSKALDTSYHYGAYEVMGAVDELIDFLNVMQKYQE